MELLVPAGDLNSFYAALNSGADAVYLGGVKFGARSYAKNFTNDELKKVIRLGKVYGVKVYVTMNTLIKDDEVTAFLEQVEYLYSLGVDAILMQDFGMICLSLAKYPNLTIHASTQFNNSSYETIKLLHEIGVKRVVLPREMSIEEISKIDIPIELEVFIHGALCVSYSGCCLFSSMLGNRSGNRGECVGNCRLPYKLYLDNDLVKEGYLLSMKELNISRDIYKLPKNITSLKIEGRMKNATYVANITNYYRKILDKKLLNPNDLEDLKTLFYRGFTKGHLLNDNNLINQKSPNHLGSYLGEVISFNDRRIRIKLHRELVQEDGIRFKNSNKGMILNYLYDLKDNLINKASKGQIIEVDNKVNLNKLDEVRKTLSKELMIDEFSITKKVPIKIEFKAKINEEFILSITDFKNTVTYKGSIVNKAINNPLSKERIKSQLEKLGNTPFISINTKINIDDNIFIRILDLNKARRTLIERLIGLRINDYKEPIIKNVTFDKFKDPSTININDYQKIERNPFYLEKALKNKSLVSNIFNPSTFDVIGYYPLNVYNIYTVYYLYKLGYKAICLSPELSKDELISIIKNIKDKFSNIPIIIKNKGFVEIMLIKGNILSLDINKTYYLVNKHKDKFKVSFDGVLTHIDSSYEININKSLFPNNNVYFLD